MRLLYLTSFVAIFSLFLENSEAKKHHNKSKLRRRKDAPGFDSLWDPENGNDNTLRSVNQLYKAFRDRSSHVGSMFHDFKTKVMDSEISEYPVIGDLQLKRRASVRKFSDFAKGLPQRKIAEKLFVYDLVLKHIVQHYHNKSENLASVSGDLRSMMQSQQDCCVGVKKKVIQKIKEIISVIDDSYNDGEPENMKTLSKAKCIIDEAVIYESYKDYGNAIRSYKESVNVMHGGFEDPEKYSLYRWSLFNAGMTLHRLLNKHQKSLSWFNRAIVAYKRASPDSTDIAVDEWYAATYYNKGQALIQLKRYPEAVESLQHAVDLLKSASSGMLITDEYRQYWLSTAERDLELCKERSSLIQ